MATLHILFAIDEKIVVSSGLPIVAFAKNCRIP
jgi:hypothetical protein